MRIEDALNGNSFLRFVSALYEIILLYHEVARV